MCMVKTVDIRDNWSAINLNVDICIFTDHNTTCLMLEINIECAQLQCQEVGNPNSVKVSRNLTTVQVLKHL